MIYHQYFQIVSISTLNVLYTFQYSIEPPFRRIISIEFFSFPFAAIFIHGIEHPAIDEPTLPAWTSNTSKTSSWIEIVNYKTNTIIKRLSHVNNINCMCSIPNNQLVIQCSTSTIYIYDIFNHCYIMNFDVSYTIHRILYVSGFYNFNGYLLVSSYDGHLRIFEFQYQHRLYLNTIVNDTNKNIQNINSSASIASICRYKLVCIDTSEIRSLPDCDGGYRQLRTYEMFSMHTI
jgi:hypothetical protein